MVSGEKNQRIRCIGKPIGNEIGADVRGSLVSFGEVTRRVQSGVKKCDASHAAAWAFPVGHVPEAGLQVDGVRRQSGQEEVEVTPAGGLAAIFTDCWRRHQGSLGKCGGSDWRRIGNPKSTVETRFGRP